MDGRELGNSWTDNFLITPINPAKHTLVARGENADESTFTATAGENVFVQIGVGLDVFVNRANLMLIDHCFRTSPYLSACGHGANL